MIHSLLFLPSLLAAVSVAPFGRTDAGQAVDLYTLTNAHGLRCKVTTYGATITEIVTPDRTGRMGCIILGFDDLSGYLKKPPYFGATIGRVGNRIAKGTFSLDGKTYHLATNDGPNHLHGGDQGFDKRVWTAKPAGDSAVEMTRTSPDGEEGYPGALQATVRFTLEADDRLRIDYTATTDRDTPINLTNHTYWNLAGEGTILDESLILHASHYTPVDDTLIPTGQIEAVKGGPMDFTKAKPIGQDIRQLTNKPQGYDHNWVLDHPGSLRRLAAQVTDPKSGRILSVYTDQPGIQFYSGNFLDGTITGRGGQVYAQYAALCLETQHFPDSINEPQFPSTVLHPGDTYRTSTIYAFSAR